MSLRDLVLRVLVCKWQLRPNQLSIPTHSSTAHATKLPSTPDIPGRCAHRICYLVEGRLVRHARCPSCPCTARPPAASSSRPRPPAQRPAVRRLQPACRPPAPRRRRARPRPPQSRPTGGSERGTPRELMPRRSLGGTHPRRTTMLSGSDRRRAALGPCLAPPTPGTADPPPPPPSGRTARGPAEESHLLSAGRWVACLSRTC